MADQKRKQGPSNPSNPPAEIRFTAKKSMMQTLSIIAYNLDISPSMLVKSNLDKIIAAYDASYQKMRE